MLKDITIGQFFPGDTLVHRLDPRVKIVLTVLLVAALFMAQGPASYGLYIVFLAAVILVSRISIKLIAKGLKPILFIIVFTAVLNIFYTPGNVLWKFWFLEITDAGLVTAFFMVLRIMLLITVTSMLTYTTSPILLTDGIEQLLGPFKRLGAPVHELAMMMSIALRFIPTLIEETDKIMNAQKARGADFETGSILKRARALVPILVPLFISAFRRADDLAVAMECRLYRGGEGRTRMRQLKITGEDRLAAALTVLFLAAVLTLGRFGL